ncbi:MAG: hypothetical protein IT266_10655 [Saprospiraceae bacterium]|nr:hypothetical protein [Saprospiraceae bacterium]
MVRLRIKHTLVFIVIVGLPLIAWFFLSKGTQLRKEAMARLEPKGAVGPFQMSVDKDSIFDAGMMSGNRWVVGILGSDSLRRRQMLFFQELMKQAGDEFPVHIFTIAAIAAGERIEGISAEMGLPISPGWVRAYLASVHVYPFARGAFEVPNVYADKDLLIFVDEERRIRNYYLLEDELDRKQAVRDLPIFYALKNVHALE